MEMVSDTKYRYQVGDLVTVYYVGFSHSRKNLGMIVRELTVGEIIDLVGPSDSVVDNYREAGTYEVYDFYYEKKFIMHGDYLVLLS